MFRQGLSLPLPLARDQNTAVVQQSTVERTPPLPIGNFAGGLATPSPNSCMHVVAQGAPKCQAQCSQQLAKACGMAWTGASVPPSALPALQCCWTVQLALQGQKTACRIPAAMHMACQRSRCGHKFGKDQQWCAVGSSQASTLCLCPWQWAHCAFVVCSQALLPTHPVASCPAEHQWHLWQPQQTCQDPQLWQASL